MKLVTVDEMRELERLSEAEGVSNEALMDAAGLATARTAWSALEHLDQTPTVVALIGAGNNGGDGLVAARLLRGWGASVTAYLCARRAPDDRLVAGCRESGVQIETAGDAQDLTGLRALLSAADLALDAVLGTGRSRPIEGSLAAIIAALNDERLARDSLCVLALDIPSGADADSGACDVSGVVADVTVTFACPKVGLLRSPAWSRAGRLVVADIGIPPRLLAPIATWAIYFTLHLPVPLYAVALWFYVYMIVDLLRQRSPTAFSFLFIVLAGRMLNTIYLNQLALLSVLMLILSLHQTSSNESMETNRK